ncbi:hypothetical protein ACI2LM_13460 [Paenibacillus lautus]|uniref:hypothetical protein n=1 Tax=Paenibacillus lautus TaxID=1401 RepID=UPI00384B0078
MANVQLPSFNTTPTDIDNSGMSELKKIVKHLLNSTVQLTEELTYLLNNLDTRNVNELNADIINAGTINAALVKIQTALMNGGFISIDDQGMKINDGTRDTMKVGLDGKPIMTGAEIRSKAGYPAVVMDPDGDLFGALKDQNNSIAIEADYAGAPRLRFDSGGQLKGSLNTILGGLTIDGIGTLWINSTGSIMLSPSTAVIVDWRKFKNSDGRNLGDALLNYATLGAQTDPSPTFNGGIPIGTQLVKADGGTVTWTGIPAHTHTQT